MSNIPKMGQLPTPVLCWNFVDMIFWVISVVDDGWWWDLSFWGWGERISFQVSSKAKWNDTNKEPPTKNYLWILKELRCQRCAISLWKVGSWRTQKCLFPQLDHVQGHGIAKAPTTCLWIHPSDQHLVSSREADTFKQRSWVFYSTDNWNGSMQGLLSSMLSCFVFWLLSPRPS